MQATETKAPTASKASGKVDLGKARLDMIDAAARLSQFIGLPRSLGQIYGLLFLSPKPLSLDDIASLLSISKASASTGTRQLAAWRAIRSVWIPGERRDHFEAEADLAGLLRTGYAEFLKPRLKNSSLRLERMNASLDEDRSKGVISNADHSFCLERLASFHSIQTKLQALAPLAEKWL